MKTRILLLILFSSFFYGSLFSQTTNFALRFNGDGKVDCGTISDLNNLDLYSVQCLVNPSEWVENAYVFKRGNGDEEYSLRFGTSGQLIYKTATQEFIVANDLPIGSWTQLTIRHLPMESMCGLMVRKSGLPIPVEQLFLRHRSHLS